MIPIEAVVDLLMTNCSEDNCGLMCRYWVILSEERTIEALSLGELRTKVRTYLQSLVPAPKLEDVPDRRVIQAEGLEDSTLHLWAKDGSVWLVMLGCRGGFEPRPCRPSNHFKLTDHVVELVETEIGVIG